MPASGADTRSLLWNADTRQSRYNPGSAGMAYCIFIQHTDTMEANGILARVPGEYVSRATKKLPPAESADDRVYEVIIDAGHAGTVRMFAQRKLAKHHKHSHWFWSVFRAEPADLSHTIPPEQ